MVVVVLFTIVMKSPNGYLFFNGLCIVLIIHSQCEVYISYMTHFKIEVMSLCKGVSKILTTYRIFKFFLLLSIIIKRRSVAFQPCITLKTFLGQNGSKL